MTVTYVDCGPIDDVALSRLHHAAFGNASAEGVSPWAARLEAHSVAWVCAYEGDELRGFVHACWDGGVHAFVLDTAVHPDCQRQGIGGELLERLAVLVRDAGCEWLHVDYEGHLDAFYRAAGFIPTLAGLRRLR